MEHFGHPLDDWAHVLSELQFALDAAKEVLGFLEHPEVLNIHWQKIFRILEL